MRERIIKSKLGVFNCFGDSIYFVFAVMNYDLWVCDRYNINLTIRELLLENGALLETYTDFHLVSKNMLSMFGDLFPLGLNHGLEIDIYLDTLQFIISFSLTLQFTRFLHSETSSIPINFNLINFICGRDLSSWNRIGGHLNS